MVAVFERRVEFPVLVISCADKGPFNGSKSWSKNKAIQGPPLGFQQEAACAASYSLGR